MKIVTWNIAALPTLVNSYGNPKARIKDIIVYLKSLKADIILLQEVFLNKIADQIYVSLERQYFILSYRKKPFGKIFNSGLMTLVLKTKFTINNILFVPYRKAAGEDRYANKGFLVVNCENLKIINTHLNANAIFSTKSRCIKARNKQIGKIYKFYKKCDKNVIMGGDFNTTGLSFDNCVCENIDYIFFKSSRGAPPFSPASIRSKKNTIITHVSDHPILICECSIKH